MPKARTVTVKTEDKFLRWQTTDKSTAKIFQGDVLEVLRTLPSKSVQMCVCSPPYYNVRDYKTGEWDGGSPECDHIEYRKPVGGDPSSRLGLSSSGGARRMGAANNTHHAYERQFKGACGKCGAVRVDKQIGVEKTVDEYVGNLVTAFTELKRVLRDDATLWVNIGDKYADDGNLEGVPWRFAFAMQDAGYILRQDIIWAKPSPMPTSVKNRCTPSHEYIFLFSKSKNYYYDNVAIKTASVSDGRVIKYDGSQKNSDAQLEYGMRTRPHTTSIVATTSNKRSVWSVDEENVLLRWLDVNHPDVLSSFLQENTGKTDVWKVAYSGYVGKHFACFPESLIEPCILAGSSEHGCCSGCSAPYRRVTEEYKLTRPRPNDFVKRTGEEGTGNLCPNTVAGVEVTTVGWEPSCSCRGVHIATDVKKVRFQGVQTEPVYVDGSEDRHTPIKSLIDAEECGVLPCVILDIFNGAATTSVCGLKHGRRVWGIELNEKYNAENSIPRISARLLDLGLGHLVPRPKVTTPIVGDVVEVL